MRWGARSGEYGNASFGDVTSDIANVSGWSDVQDFFANSWSTFKGLQPTLVSYMHRAAQAKAAADAVGDSENSAAAAALLEDLSNTYTMAGSVLDQIKNLLSYIPGVPASWTQ